MGATTTAILNPNVREKDIFEFLNQRYDDVHLYLTSDNVLTIRFTLDGGKPRILWLFLASSEVAFNDHDMGGLELNLESDDEGTRIMRDIVEEFGGRFQLSDEFPETVFEWVNKDKFLEWGLRKTTLREVLLNDLWSLTGDLYTAKRAIRMMETYIKESSEAAQ